LGAAAAGDYHVSHRFTVAPFADRNCGTSRPRPEGPEGTRSRSRRACDAPAHRRAGRVDGPGAGRRWCTGSAGTSATGDPSADGRRPAPDESDEAPVAAPVAAPGYGPVRYHI